MGKRGEEVYHDHTVADLKPSGFLSLIDCPILWSFTPNYRIKVERNGRFLVADRGHKKARYRLSTVWESSIMFSADPAPV